MTHLYASVGPTLTRYGVDVPNAALTRHESIELPENIQYAWPHASNRTLYVATSNSASGLGPAGDRHHVTALALDPEGRLTPHGAPIELPTRPIHIATDIPSRVLLAAFSNPAGLRTYRINDDRTLGGEIPQPSPIDPGIYPHQVRATLDNRHVILVSRGHNATGTKPEEPGSLHVFENHDGALVNQVTAAPGGGYGFGPRHLDFHPAKPWVYVSLERQNALSLFTLDNGTLSPQPVATVPTLAGPAQARQVAGTVHVHPNGHVVYVANRASSTVDHQGQPVFAGGENSFAVYAIDPVTGVPSLIQHIDTAGIHCRTFHIDPSGQLLVAAHIMPMTLATGETIPARLCTFRIAPDGRLSFARAYDVDVGGKSMFWMGMVA